jgi:diaminopropionate ammonia-lyase
MEELMPVSGSSSPRHTLYTVTKKTRSGAYRNGIREEILSLEALHDAMAEITTWPGYAPTPLMNLDGLAATLGISQIFYKHEADRFGIGSFKALGGAYAVLRLLKRQILVDKGVEATAAQIASGMFADVCAKYTVTCATDGNHGRSVAWGARTFGCKCTIYIHAAVSRGRSDTIATYGAEVRRVPGNYDDAVRQASLDAQTNGWQVVSDTSYEGYTDVPRDVMQGYGVMVEEALRQLPAGRSPTHVFVQGGVGGLAAAVCATLWEALGARAPYFVLVEPAQAACLFSSAVAGNPVIIRGALDTVMAGLACGEVSVLAWEILKDGADAFMMIDDQAAIDAMRLLADGMAHQRPLVAGESAVAGLAGLIEACRHREQRANLRLDRDSVVLLFGTEGATDPELYEALVGKSATAVLAP